MLNNILKFILVLLISVNISFAGDLDKLLSISGIKESISQVPKSMASATTSSLSGQKKELLDEYNNAVYDSFDIQNILDNVKIYLNENLSSHSLKKSLAWYESDLGQKIKELMLVKPKKVTQEDIEYLKSNKKRFNLMKSIDHYTHASEGGIQVSLTTQRAMMDSMMALMPENMKMPKDEIENMIEEGKGHIIKSVTAQVLTLLLVNLQSVSTSDLETYLKFAKSSDGQEFFTKSNDAVELSIKRASETFGSKMAQITMKSAGIK